MISSTVCCRYPANDRPCSPNENTSRSLLLVGLCITSSSSLDSVYVLPSTIPSSSAHGATTSASRIYSHPALGSSSMSFAAPGLQEVSFCAYSQRLAPLETNDALYECGHQPVRTNAMYHGNTPLSRMIASSSPVDFVPCHKSSPHRRLIRNTKGHELHLDI